jgi:hypothetical protein
MAPVPATRLAPPETSPGLGKNGAAPPESAGRGLFRAKFGETKASGIRRFFTVFFMERYG